MKTSLAGFDFSAAATLSERFRLQCDALSLQPAIRQMADFGVVWRKMEEEREATRKIMAAITSSPMILAQAKLFESTETMRIVAGITENARLCTTLINEAALAAVKPVSDIFRTTSALSQMLSLVSPMMRLATFDYSSVASAYCDFHAKLGNWSKVVSNPALLDIPVRETFFSADALIALTDDEVGEGDDERDALRAGYEIHIQGTLEGALTDIAPEWRHSLVGAKQIIASDNPDRVREACVSLRSLTLGVLEVLAPDNAVEQWSSSKRDFRDGKPTTQARICFIVDQLRCEPLSAFLDADGVAMHHLLKVLNTGIHERKCPLDSVQLRYTFRRVEGFLCAILEALRG